MATTAIPRIISATDNATQTKPGENAVGGVGAPPTAAAAPKPGATTVGSGLCAALNTFYAEQAKKVALYQMFTKLNLLILYWKTLVLFHLVRWIKVWQAEQLQQQQPINC